MVRIEKAEAFTIKQNLELELECEGQTFILSEEVFDAIIAARYDLISSKCLELNGRSPDESRIGKRRNLSSESYYHKSTSYKKRRERINDRLAKGLKII